MELPDLPHGYVVRAPHDEDAEAVADLLNAHSRALTGEDDATADEMRLDWSTPGWDMERDCALVLAADGSPAAYVSCWDHMEPHVRPHAWGRVHPDHSGRGLGAWTVAWCEARGRLAVDRAPEGARVAVMNSVLHADEPAREVLASRGWSHVRSFYRMVIDFDGPLVDAPFADGVTLRTFVPGEDPRALAAATDASFSDHWGHVHTPLDEQMKHWVHWIEKDTKHDPTLWFIAESGGEIVGMSLCAEEAEGDPERGWCNTLGVVREWRRKGLGIALLVESFRVLRERGKKGVGLGVDASSLTGATRLYEKAGMYVARQSDAFELVLREGKDLSVRDLDG